jgi:DinB superfamily
MDNLASRIASKTPADEWFRQPPGGVSHVAWQVGHIAFSEYRLALWRIRGERPDDAALFSPDFKQLFGANSVPQADSAYPPAELRAVLAGWIGRRREPPSPQKVMSCNNAG